MLMETADRMRSALRAGDVLARLGGDEFGALLMDTSDGEAMAAVDRLSKMTPELGSFSAGVAVSLFIGIFLVLGALFSLVRPKPATLLEDEKAERRPATPGRSPGGESSAAAIRTPELKEVSS